MRLVEYESKIKELVKIDIRNPEIYNLLVKFVNLFLLRKKVVSYSRDREEICYTLASDIYMKLIQGEELTHYLGYLEKIYRAYIYEYAGYYRKDFVVDDLIDLEEMLPSRDQPYTEVLDRIYLRNIWCVIKEILNYCKYSKRSSIRANLEVSLLLSLYRNDIVNFNLEEVSEAYAGEGTRFYSRYQRSGF